MTGDNILLAGFSRGFCKNIRMANPSTNFLFLYNEQFIPDEAYRYLDTATGVFIGNDPSFYINVVADCLEWTEKTYLVDRSKLIHSIDCFKKSIGQVNYLFVFNLPFEFQHATLDDVIDNACTNWPHRRSYKKSRSQKIEIPHVKINHLAGYIFHEIFMFWPEGLCLDNWPKKIQWREKFIKHDNMLSHLPETNIDLWGWCKFRPPNTSILAISAYITQERYKSVVELESYYHHEDNPRDFRCYLIPSQASESDYYNLIMILISQFKLDDLSYNDNTNLSSDQNVHETNITALGPSTPAPVKSQLDKMKNTMQELEILQKLYHKEFPIIGNSIAVNFLCKEMLLPCYDKTGNVLIIGETGTGKELVAKVIGSISSGKKYKACNCAQLTNNLAHSLTFGHINGAFTGADSETDGLIKENSNDTIFFDEIQSMPEPAMPMLLRFLESGEFCKLGEFNKIRHSNTRIIAATNDKTWHANEKLKSCGFLSRFRYVINVPSLKFRLNDIPLLLMHFLENFTTPEIIYHDSWQSIKMHIEQEINYLRLNDELVPNTSQFTDRKYFMREVPEQKTSSIFYKFLDMDWTDSNIRGLKSAFINIVMKEFIVKDIVKSKSRFGVSKSAGADIHLDDDILIKNLRNGNFEDIIIKHKTKAICKKSVTNKNAIVSFNDNKDKPYFDKAKKLTRNTIRQRIRRIKNAIEQQDALNIFNDNESKKKFENDFDSLFKTDYIIDRTMIKLDQ